MTRQEVVVEGLPELELALDALGVRWRLVRSANGRAALVAVEMDTATDERLEALVEALGRLRWAYEPGRTVQLELL